MRFFRPLGLIMLLSALFTKARAQAPDCSGATLTANRLVSSTTCNNVGGSLNNMNVSSTTAAPISTGNCGTTGSHWDGWYSFVAQSTTHTVTISGFAAQTNITSPKVQIFESCTTLSSSLACGSTTATATNLIVGNTYLVRVSQVGTTDPTGTGQRAGFSICVTHPFPAPANDLCTAAINLTSATTCTNVSGTLSGATVSSPAVASTCAGTPGGDVWYSFVATTAYPTINLSSIGNGFSGATANMQLLTGNCTSGLTSVACVSGTGSSLSLNTLTTPGGSGLAVGTTYYIRLYSSNTAPGGTTWNFNICVTNPVATPVEYSRSYINVTKGATGGTVDPGDILEMRAILVIPSNTATNGRWIDSLSFIDTIYAGSGLTLVPNSIALRTNEGKVYGNNGASFTDAFDIDQAWTTSVGGNTIVRLNFGQGASAFARGRSNNASRPSVFGSTYIVMATYRVQVTAAYNSRINFRTGALTLRDATTGVFTHATFGRSELIVYSSPGLCPNAVSVANSIGVESNGTFGTPAATNPLVKDRGTSAFTNYTYAPFTLSSPGDDFYGITNNTSGNFTTTTTYGKPESPNLYRVFGQWDITGDHTGTGNSTIGNPPCDINRPVSATNPCGYMLVVNSAYKPDTAFKYTMTNLCPNTNYEISVWLKNICYKCGGDSTGRTSNQAGYIPYATGDSSGVQPNLAFDVDGVDYYTTGDIRYIGTTPTGSDASNRWVKRGFTYITGANQTSFTLTIRNNAPGGGGNDWALDDIAVYTCLPNMNYSPTTTPTICANNPVLVSNTVRSFFSNYNHFKWQRSTDAGTTWSDIAGMSGTSTPQLVSGQWEYTSSYTIPNSATRLTNNGDRYRMMVATSSTNLGSSTCQSTDGVSLVTLNIQDCRTLPLTLLSFSGRFENNRSLLSWSTTQQDEPARFGIERSDNGVQYKEIGYLLSKKGALDSTYKFTFTDSLPLPGKNWYRLSILQDDGKVVYSNNIMLQQQTDKLQAATMENPFTNTLTINLNAHKNTVAAIKLINLSGVIMKQQNVVVTKGSNSVSLRNLEQLSTGVYLLEIRYPDKVLMQKVFKRP